MGHPVRESVQEYARGIAGGLLFSLPLLYTMEVWWTGFVATPFKLLIHLGVTYVLLLGFNKYVGLRHDASRREIAIDSVEELGIGIVLSALILLLVARLDDDQSFREILGKIVIEGCVAAIGVSVGTAQLGENPEADAREDRPLNFFGQILIALCGAVIVGANVAPTEEILLIASESSSRHLLAMSLFGIALAAMIVRGSSIKRAKELTSQFPLNPALFSAIVSTAVGLVASAYMLWFFGRFDGASLWLMVGLTVTLGFPALLGATLGRILIQL